MKADIWSQSYTRFSVPYVIIWWSAYVSFIYYYCKPVGVEAQTVFSSDRRLMCMMFYMLFKYIFTLYLYMKWKNMHYLEVYNRKWSQIYTENEDDTIHVYYIGIWLKGRFSVCSNKHLFERELNITQLTFILLLYRGLHLFRLFP